MPNGATVTYQWQSATTSGGSYANISGATSSTYLITGAYESKYLRVLVTGTWNYIGSQSSNPTTQVAADPDWITIGAQTWRRRNLNVGNMISNFSDQGNNGTVEKYCQGGVLTNCDTYGGLYQWNEAMQFSTADGAQGICPTGSHIPTDFDWKLLEVTLGMSWAQVDATSWRGTNQGAQLKSGGASGFNILFNGNRDSFGNFNGLGNYTHLWTSTQTSGSAAMERYFGSGYDTVRRLQYDKVYGESVRCVKN